jgi:hypothetical protein
MDCEKFESTMIDELYDELDELTSAAAKRHVAGCARCASLFGGLRATRRVAVLPLASVPEGLEDRILAAARQAQKVVPIRSRVARAVSTAGSWAMRPQTAMAALFLLMIGSSVLFLRTKHSKAPGSSTVTVSQLGEPSPAGQASATAFADNNNERAEGDNKKGGAGDLGGTFRGGDVPQAKAADKATLDGLARDDSRRLRGDLEDEHTRALAHAAPQPTYAYGPNGLPPSENNAAPVPYPPPPPAAAAGAAPRPEAQGQTQTASTGSPTFNAGMAAFNAQRYGEAFRIFDSLSANDINAALYAARSLVQISGCSAAAPRFDEVAMRGAGTQQGWDATFDGGRCYRLIGAFDMARDHMRTLLNVPRYAAQAQQELDAIDRAQAVAARARQAQQPPAATATATPPAAAPASPPAADTNNTSHQ